MSAHMKAPHTSNVVKVTIEISVRNKRVVYIPADNFEKVETFLQKHSTSEESIETDDWKTLAKDRIEKYKKAGIVLRGARYREHISQKELAKRSKTSQADISKIENGKRTVGEKLAKRLARVLNIDYKMLLES